MIETIKNIWNLSKNRHKSFVTALISSFLRSVFGVTQIIAIMLTIDAFSGNGDVNKTIIYVAVLTLICVSGNFVTSYIEQINTMKTGCFMTADQRINVGKMLRKVPLGFFNNSSVSRVTTTLTTNLSNLETSAPMVMIGVVSGLFNSLVLFLFMMFYDWRIGIISGLGMICYLLVVNWQMHVSRKNAPYLQKAQNELSLSTLNFLKGIKVTKSFSFKEGDKVLNQAILSSRKENIRLTNVSMPSQFSAKIVIALFESFILISVILFKIKLNDISLIKTIVLIIFSFMVYSSLDQAGSILSMIGLMDGGINEVKSLNDAGTLKTYPPVSCPLNDEINFNNVSFSYGNKEVLHNINLNIPPHTLTALVGPSGSGKTTLCQLIPRFQEISSGEITLGGVNIKNIEYEELMKKISIVFQNVYLFSDTILNNIRFARPDATLEEVQTVAKKAQCHDFIMKLPDGYNTVIAEGGNSLSGGEKQRISIARAMLKDSPIIILDEATSALDGENEREIMSAIDQLTSDKTVIMIAHKIRTVEKADKIVVIENGKITEEGTHAELKGKEGTYKDFIEARERATDWKISN